MSTSDDTAHHTELTPSCLELGKTSTYESTYNPKKLFAIARRPKRIELGIMGALPFAGYDVWNHYEVSWLDTRGKPRVALAQIVYDCASENIVESKSLKLYFNSLNNTRFASHAAVCETVARDLSACVKAPVTVELYPLHSLRQAPQAFLTQLEGECLDDIEIDIDRFRVDASYLTTGDAVVEEVLYSDLLKSNCLVTGQPDWGSIWIQYRGQKIDRAGLLRYIVSFRDHNEFHEQCVERIFVDVLTRCAPEALTVGARYTRRGGIDINPLRSTEKLPVSNLRLIRQ